MLPHIPNTTAIFFSAHQTLRTLVPDPAAASQAASAMLRLLQARESCESLLSRLESRWEVYQALAENCLLDVSEGELWTRHLLPEYEPNLVYANASSLTRLWLDREGRRECRPGMSEVLRELHRRGYTLGILENTASESELEGWLVAEGLVSCFQTVLLSCKIRLRKPDSAAFRLAARCVGVPVSECAFVGRRRDLDGAVAAQYGVTVMLGEGEAAGLPYPMEYAADPEELLTLFPERH